MKIITLLSLLLLGSCCAAPGTSSEYVSLFDGATMGSWKPVDFGGEGPVEIRDGLLVLESGNSLTGVVWQGKAPLSMNYEIELEAMRLDGNDFFCGLTFPYNDTSCSLIVGGWGGGLVGLSSIDDLDASENDFSDYLEFESDRWYKIRVRVTREKIIAWIDDKEVVHADIGESRVGVRFEMEFCMPLGLATFETTAAYRNFRMKAMACGRDEARGTEARDRLPANR